jgi:hypothetical protein
MNSEAYDDIITIAVGLDNAKKKYRVYRGLLCHFSGYFDRMLNGSFKESGSTYLHLRDIDADTFHVFYYWLNSGIVDHSIGNKLLTHDDYWEKITALYVFADFHQADVFRNSVLDTFFLHIEANMKLAISVTPYIYTNTTEGDVIRKLLIDLMVEIGSFKYCKKEGLDDIEKEFLFDCITACTEKKLVPGTSCTIVGFRNMRKEFCQRYHHHDERTLSRKNGES